MPSHMRNWPLGLPLFLRGRARALSVVALFALGSAACEKVTSENIQLWKTTEKGPGKLAQAVRDGHVAPELRAESALALIDLGQWDDVVAAWTALPPESRTALATSALPVATAAMKGPAPEKALTYRDFAFFFRSDLPPGPRATLDADLLSLLLADLKVGRIRSGHVSVEKIFHTLGPTAWSSAANLLAEPVVAYPAIAELIGRGGDPGARAKAAQLLVVRMKGQAHPPAELWRSLGFLGGPTVAGYLTDRLKAASSSPEDALFAARVLVEHPQSEALPVALKIAADPSADKALRDECFGIAEAGGPAAVSGLLGALKGAKEEMVRYRAFEAVLGAGKESVLVQALDAFPSAATYKRADVDDLLVTLIAKMGAAARPALVKGLASPSSLTRMTSALALERVGKADDTAALEAKAQDPGTVKGFPPGDTVGREAARVATVVKKRP